MKPDTSTAMHQLIEQVRDSIPFSMPVSDLCSGICNGCSKKLIDYLDMELVDWEQRLDAGELPKLGDINRLAKTSWKIYRVLQKNQLIPE
ncbi:hypothetical protein [Neptunomonas concharum]|uniref:Uncharacterized protein n=1 Tax=Neptunomonas concharum TaxID=1031538 RepID=A0A5P1RCJ8_9GAMM|nr:hypothetical protein [Neptunomonas concharum]QEQ96975.1 hypothetical protein F0U83_09710 [Neptunomonas concharum]